MADISLNLFKARILGIGVKPDHTCLLLRVTHAGDCDMEDINDYTLADPVLATIRLRPDTLGQIEQDYADLGVRIAKNSRVLFSAKGILRWDPNYDKSSHWGDPIHRLSHFSETSLCPAQTRSRESSGLLDLRTVKAPSVSKAASIPAQEPWKSDVEAAVANSVDEMHRHEEQEDLAAELRAAFDDVLEYA